MLPSKDVDSDGAITYPDFIRFETRSLLAKKNKVELANYLSLKELVLMKRLFLQYDREHNQIIGPQAPFFDARVKSRPLLAVLSFLEPEDARAVYAEYCAKLR